MLSGQAQRRRQGDVQAADRGFSAEPDAIRTGSVMPRSAPPTLLGAARVRRTVRSPADPATIPVAPPPMRLVPTTSADAPDVHATKPAVDFLRLRFNPEALLLRGTAAGHHQVGALAGLAAAAAATLASAAADADAGWALRRADDRGRIPALEIAATTPTAQLATASLSLMVVFESHRRPGVVRRGVSRSQASDTTNVPATWSYHPRFQLVLVSKNVLRKDSRPPRPQSARLTAGVKPSRSMADKILGIEPSSLTTRIPMARLPNVVPIREMVTAWISPKRMNSPSKAIGQANTEFCPIKLVSKPSGISASISIP
jgi:hypothetical protein